MKTKGERTEDDEGPSPENDRDDDCQGHSSLDAPSELNPPQRIPSLLLSHY